MASASAQTGRLVSKYDLAYVRFLPPGLACLTSIASTAIPIATDGVEALGLLILIPLMLATLLWMPTGIYISTLLRRDSALSLLLLATIFMVAVFVLNDFLAEPWLVSFSNTSAKAYGILVMSLEALWFLIRRRQVAI